LTDWLAYFLQSMAEEFQRVAAEVRTYAESPAAPEPVLLQRLDRRARLVLECVYPPGNRDHARGRRALGLAPRTARDLLTEWVVAGLARSRRAFAPGALLPFIGGISAVLSAIYRRNNKGTTMANTYDHPVVPC
jgi:hypothetical protein